MKKRLTFLFVAILVAASLWAQEFQSGDLKYKIISSGDEGNAVAVVKGDNYKALTEVIIPETVEYENVEYSVTRIGDRAFSSCSSLISITIPESVISIGSMTFNRCTNLTSITIFGSVTSIGSMTFSDCISLTSITIPESVTSIGSSAFKGCTNLTSITIPGSVTNIGGGIFKECINLTSVTVKATTPPTALNGLDWPDGINVFVPEEVVEAYKSAEYWKDLNILAIGTPVPIGTEFKYDGLYYRVKEDYTLEIFKNWNYDYGSGSLTSVVIPESVTYNDYTYPVTSLSYSAFSGWKDLSSVTIPNSITSIGQMAFWGCGNLESITIPEGVTNIEYYAFADCRSLTSITIPESVTSIGERAFYSCSSLASITMPNSVTDIGKEAFSYSGLTSIIIPESVTSIGEWAFAFCSRLTSITISEGVTNIGNNAFYHCSSLTSIIIPKSVTSIGDAVFFYCSSLTSIMVETENNVYDSRENCNAIIETTSNSLIIGCQNTVIPNSVTSIGACAFVGCSNLTSITIPESVTGIGIEAFADCSSLTSITVEIENNVYDSRENCNAIIETTSNSLIIGCQNTVIPNSVTSIGKEAFSLCRSLTSIIIPESVTSIGEWAFAFCSRLTSIIIPKSVISIENYAFMYCDGLTSMIVEATVPPAAEDLRLSAELPIYVPMESVEAYKSVEYWKNLNIIGYVETGIDDIVVDNTDMATRKMMRGGKLIIRKNGKSYNLQGVEIK